MSFSAVTCLTYTGTTTLGGVLNLYSDVDGFNNPFQTNINLSAITGNQCPYYINNVPDFTTQIRVFDISTNCYCDIPVQSNDLCITCDLDFNLYSASTIGRLVAGNLTGSCESNITDYRIFWYETGDTTNPIFISGKGMDYTPYSFTHPLTGTSSIFAPAGTYIPVIDKIKLSGLTFSQTGGTGSIPAELECFTSTTITIEAFTCDNGTSNDPNYEHQVSFSGAAAGVVPQALEGTFLFTGITNYFAWKFRGYAIPDRLRLTYYGSAYSEPLLIEDIEVGSNLTNTNFSLSIIPKRAKTSSSTFFIKKVNCLTGITKNINDTLKLEVIPNSANTQTNWDFYFTCLDSFNQDSCIFNNTPYKISASTITSSTGLCNTNSISYWVSGCPTNVDDYTKYINNDEPTQSILSDGSVYYTSSPSMRLINAGQLKVNSISYTNYLAKNITPLNCGTPSSNTITYKKYISGGTQGVIDMEFSSINDFNTYYDSYLSVSTGNTVFFEGGCVSSSGPWSGTPFNSTDIRYYRYYGLAIPSNTGASNCGDGTTQRNFRLHPSTVVTSGTSGPNHTLRFTMPTIVNNLTYDPLCNISGSVQSIVNEINLSSTGTTNNFTGTTSTGSKYSDPFYLVLFGCSGVTTFSASTASDGDNYPKYLNETIVYTGTTPTLVPSLSAKTFNFDYPRFTLNSFSNNNSYFNRWQYYYTVKLNNPSDFRDFEIYASELTGGTVGSQVLIYGYTGSTGQSFQYQPSYFI